MIHAFRRWILLIEPILRPISYLSCIIINNIWILMSNTWRTGSSPMTSRLDCSEREPLAQFTRGSSPRLAKLSQSKPLVWNSSSSMAMKSRKSWVLLHLFSQRGGRHERSVKHDVQDSLPFHRQNIRLLFDLKSRIPGFGVLWRWWFVGRPLKKGQNSWTRGKGDHLSDCKSPRLYRRFRNHPQRPKAWQRIQAKSEKSFDL